MTARAIIVCLFFLFQLTLDTYAQSYLPRIRQYTTKEGLSHNSIYCMHKDARGFLWFGTGYGLNRYNGKEFEWFLKENKGLSSNFIHRIFEDAAGYLWLITLEDEYDLKWFEIRSISLLNIYNGETLSLEERFGDELPFTKDSLHFIKKLPDESLLFIMEDGNCFQYHPNSDFRQFRLNFKFRKILDLISINDSTYWVLVDEEWQPPHEALIKIDTTGQVLKRLDPYATEDSYYVGRNDQNEHWFGLKMDGTHLPPIPLYTISSEGVLVEPDLFALNLPWEKIGQPPRFRTIQLDNQHNFFWTKANRQIFIFHPEKGLIYDFENSLLSRDERWDMKVLFDNKTTWMTDGKSGLSAIELKPNYFQKYLSIQPVTSPDVYSCRGIVTDNLDRLWVGTYKESLLFDKKSREVKIIEEAIAMPMMKDSKGNIWTANEFGLRRFQSEDYRAELFKYEDISDGGLWSLFEDNRGYIWYSNGIRPYSFNPATGDFQNFQAFNEFTDLNNCIIYCIKQRDEKTLWMAGSLGLFILHYEKGVIAQYNSKQTDANFIPAKDIHHLYEDKEGVLWLATGDGGLIQLNINKEKLIVDSYRQFTIANGLSSNSLHAVYEDDYEHLWISSDNGINQFNKPNFQVKNYFLEEGVSDNEFNRISHYQAEDGTIYFGSVNGVTGFHPKDFYENETANYNVPLEVIAFQQFSGKKDSLEDRTIELMQSNLIELQPGDRFFNLKVALLDFENNESVQYAHLIEGLNKDWTFSRNNQLNFSGLPYGDFILKIKGHNGDGRFSSNELVIPIHVIRPIYLRWWFLAFAILGSLVSMFAFFKWRTAQLLQQRNRLEKLVKERTQTISEQTEQLRQLDKVKSRFFANVSHELRTPLTLMLAPISTLKKGKESKSRRVQLLQVAQNNGRQLLRLVNEILDLTKLESDKLKLKETPILLLTLMRRLVANFESFAKEKGVHLAFKYQADEALFLYLDVDKFEKIINNLLSNALKFTPKGGAVSIVIETREKQLLLKVQDNGQGIHPDDLLHVFERFYQSQQPDAPVQGGTGIGLALCREFADLFKGKVWAESRVGEGSTFYFEFPYRLAVEDFPFSNEILAPEKDAGSAEMPSVIPPNLLEESITAQTDNRQLATDNGQPITILIVEDNPSLRAYLQSILEEKYQIITAQNGQEALERLTVVGLEQTDSHPPSLPSLIISDVMMPIMDGFTFLNHLKSKPNLQHLPVIMLTARAEKEDKLRALRIGVDDYMLKPFEEEELLVRIENLLRNSLERRHFFESEFAENASAPAEIIERPQFSIEDQEWLADLESTVQKQIDNFGFNTEGLAQDMALSRRQLNRRIKKMTGLTSSEYIREVRFQRARHLLEIRKYATVKAVAYSVGVKALDYFSKQFKERFGKNPSEYL